jgi:hypothetical protein
LRRFWWQTAEGKWGMTNITGFPKNTLKTQFTIKIKLQDIYFIIFLSLGANFEYQICPFCLD